MPAQRFHRDGKAITVKLNIEPGTFVYLPGQAINFDQRCELRNGQHRLLGLAISSGDDKYIEVDICTQTTDKEILALDLGTPRNLADMMTFRNGRSAVENQSVSSIGKSVAMFVSGVGSGDDSTSLLRAAASGGSNIISPEAQNEVNEVHGDGLSEASAYTRRQLQPGEVKLLLPRIEGLFYYVFGLINKEKALTFLNQLATGNDLSKGSPMLVLRKALTPDNNPRRKSQTVQPREVAFYVAKTWNAIELGQELKFLKYTIGEAITIAGMAGKLDGHHIKMAVTTGKNTKEIRQVLGKQETKPKAKAASIAGLFPTDELN
jgi:hypothetical protein